MFDIALAGLSHSERLQARKHFHFPYIWGQNRPHGWHHDHHDEYPIQTVHRPTRSRWPQRMDSLRTYESKSNQRTRISPARAKTQRHTARIHHQTISEYGVGSVCD